VILFFSFTGFMCACQNHIYIEVYIRTISHYMLFFHMCYSFFVLFVALFQPQNHLIFHQRIYHTFYY
jgi:hypothetical protein